MSRCSDHRFPTENVVDSVLFPGSIFLAPSRATVTLEFDLIPYGDGLSIVISVTLFFFWEDWAVETVDLLRGVVVEALMFLRPGLALAPCI